MTKRLTEDGPLVSGGFFGHGMTWGKCRCGVVGALVHGECWGCLEARKTLDRLATNSEGTAGCAECAPAPRDCEATPRDGHLGGPDDNHYAQLAVQPIEVTEAWAPSWPAGIGYHLGEAVAAIARCGTRGQAVRDLRKASWLLERAADVLEGKAKHPNDKRGR